MSPSIEGKALQPFIAHVPPVRKPPADNQRFVWGIMKNDPAVLAKAVERACTAVPAEDPPAAWRKEDAALDILDGYRSTARAQVKPAIIEALAGAFEAAETQGPAAVDAIPTALLALLHQRMPEGYEGLKDRVGSALARRLAAERQITEEEAAALLDPSRPVQVAQMQAALDRGTGPDAAPAYACRELDAEGRFTEPATIGAAPALRLAVKDGDFWMSAFGRPRPEDGRVDFVIFQSSRTPDADASRERLVQALREQHGDRLGEVLVVPAELGGQADNSSYLWTTSVSRAHERFLADMPDATAHELHHALTRCATLWSHQTPLQREEYLAAARAEFLGGVDLHHRPLRPEVVGLPDLAPADDTDTPGPRVTDSMLTDELEPTQPEGTTARLQALRDPRGTDRAEGEVEVDDEDEDDEDVDLEDIPVDFDVPQGVEGQAGDTVEGRPGPAA